MTGHPLRLGPLGGTDVVTGHPLRLGPLGGADVVTGRPLRLGLLGCADVATRRVLPAVAAVPGIELAVVASRSEAKARAVADAFGGEPVRGYQRLLDRADVDAVYVPLPSGLHAEWVRRALLAGKHVLAEKPLTTDLATTVELVELARGADLVLRENFMFVHHSQHGHVARLLADGAIGALRSFAATFAIPPRPPGDIRHRPELGGGALLDVGAYPLRAAQLLLGPELEVVGAALRHDDDLGVDLGGGVLVRRADGVTGHLAFGLEHRYTSRYELLGSTGRLSVDHVFTPPATHRPVVALDRQDDREEFVLPADDQCANSVAAFARAVREGPAVDDSTVVQAGLVEHSRRAAARRATDREALQEALQPEGTTHG
ncbi:Gfo/Idh/MocA family protein [Saccharothrix variisporea]|uniref:Putative dehydrogenase n=1 Tax=Saccharothrix variisporea TaxID=543527 RepID=A0A495XQJ4_9PSEU|nr:Gfo/Idh/MocA family oxidoreductase [Saccharothrix variisporea]RKT74713.1 putative dehydrogenase [Saccharothrix variisporea]